MIDITILITMHKTKNSTLTPFSFKLADLSENVRGQGSEKWLLSLRNGSEKRLLSLRNGSEKRLLSLRNGSEKWLLSLRNTILTGAWPYYGD